MQHDVVIIGSGHAGGMAAYELTRRGISCLMLNAGPLPDLDADQPVLPAHKWAYRGFTEPGSIGDGAINETWLNAFVHPNEVPYSYDAGRPYVWVRNRLVGGRSIFWSRQSWRLSDLEFGAKDFDGYGDNWPIRLTDLEPFYAEVEKMYRVSGRPEGLPQFPDMNFQVINNDPDPELIKRVAAVARERGITVTKNRTSLGVNGLASSINLLLPPALRTGRLEIVADAVVHRLTTDKTGRINEIAYIERQTRRPMTLRPKLVILAAGTLESTRVLLNSGIANSSGVLGHYLFDQYYGTTAIGRVPLALRGQSGGSGVVVPFQNVKEHRSDYLRRFLMTLSVGANPTPEMVGGYGRDLEARLAADNGAMVVGTMMGEVLPRRENHVRLNPKVTDSWGIPTLHISTAYGDNERAMHRAASDAAAEMIQAAGFELLYKCDTHREPGQSVHELGTCRMGEDPRTSVVDKWNRSHDVPNLFVVDGGAFVTGGWQNPTITLSALSMRAAAHLADQLKAGQV